METENLDFILDNPDIKTTEVMIGLSENESITQLEEYLEEEGTVLKDIGFDIYRIRITRDMLCRAIDEEPEWIDYIEHAGDGIVPLYNTENLDIEDSV